MIMCKFLNNSAFHKTTQNKKNKQNDFNLIFNMI